MADDEILPMPDSPPSHSAARASFMGVDDYVTYDYDYDYESEGSGGIYLTATWVYTLRRVILNQCFKDGCTFKLAFSVHLLCVGISALIIIAVIKDWVYAYFAFSLIPLGFIFLYTLNRICCCQCVCVDCCPGFKDPDPEITALKASRKTRPSIVKPPKTLAETVLKEESGTPVQSTASPTSENVSPVETSIFQQQEQLDQQEDQQSATLLADIHSKGTTSDVTSPSSSSEPTFGSGTSSQTSSKSPGHSSYATSSDSSKGVGSTAV